MVGGAILQQVMMMMMKMIMIDNDGDLQTFVVEFVVAYQMCPDCHRTEAKDHWNCLVQVSLEKFESHKVELG